MSDVDVIKAALAKSEPKEIQLNKKAVEDLKYLCMQVGCGLFHNVQYQALFRETEKICDLLVVYYDAAQKKAVVPSEHIKFNDGGEKHKMYVAVVCYEDDKATGAYLFDGSEFKKPGLFSLFDVDKKQGTASINMSNKAKLNKYSFGNVIMTFGKGGAK